MKLTYKQRIFCYFLVIFVLFAGSIIIFEQSEEKKYRTDDLIARLDRYSEIVHKYIEQNQLNDTTIPKLHNLADILPDDIRITVIGTEGKVKYDKDVTNLNTLENHLDRPEIRNAQYQSHGWNIRMSASTKHEYIYYARHYPSYYVRVALPYNIETKNMLQADKMFIYIVGIMFIIVLVLLNYAAGRFSSSIARLKTFTSLIKGDKPLPKDIHFPDDELGEIGYELVDIFDQKEKIKHNIELEREKIIRHFQFSEEGLCIFSSDRKKVYANTHFIHFMNFIADKPMFNVDMIFKEDAFSPIMEFLDDTNKVQNHSIFELNRNGKVFLIKTIVFEDKSFEITIKDITKVEKNRLLKQEMTNNIAHELRTPVTSLRGYLETLNEQSLPADKQKQFIDRAYQQSIRLSNLIDDVSLISKMEESTKQFTTENINLSQVINDVRIDLTDKLVENDIKLDISLKDDLHLTGNYTLLYSIFRNLIDNSISYAGPHTEIHINNYMEDEKFLYLSFYDTGKGVGEEHLNRLFERFYRVSEGRTRDTGGSGLGLSIVRNAVLFHKGEIQVKNRIDGGLEFLFTLKK
ncbi:cell wall metabolism sensor histidine kinase WalK [Dysgonomonas sp. ZJ709]|uniref:sensor histidine kinase n=1 Tax=Dysgonomonas sp. ZJ709 TaxID=2709797 RepID=UPI0013EDEFB4|nr:ATP-binding protein [Dysgonomonas sp. ZJ709]